MSSSSHISMNETSIMHIVRKSENIYKHTVGRLKAEVNKYISKGGIYPNDIPSLLASFYYNTPF